MRAIASRFSAIALLLSCCSMTALSIGTARAEDVKPKASSVDLSYHSLERLVANTSIIWVDQDYQQIHQDASVPRLIEGFGKALAHYLKPEEGIKPEPIQPTAFYESLGAYVLPVSPDDAQGALDHLEDVEGLSPEDARAIRETFVVSPDMIVSILNATDCADRDAKELGQSGLQPNTVPVGVKRIGGGTQANFTRKIWIVDTGLDNASNFITVDANNAANCTLQAGGTTGATAMCKSSSAASFDQDLADQVGHGTMLAGIAAATGGTASGPSLVGVAPGATVVPVKIFGSQPDINLAGPPLAALDYVASHAATGDIVNLSWGAAWLEGMDRQQNLLATVLGQRTSKTGLIARLKKLIADKQLTIVTAAGNVDSVTRPSWVQFVMPAGAGSFPAPNTGCSLCTVSAVESKQDSNGKWSDVFWYDYPATATGSPRFGSDYGHNPPDFAEPGVNVISLWPRGTAHANRVNSCSGTSFAAAYLSGILVQGKAAAEYTVMRDPVSPGDPANANPVGVLAKSTAQ